MITSNLTSVKNIRFSNFEKTQIDCDITTSQFGDEVLPFTASMTDVEPHGRALFTTLLAGSYGPVEEYQTDSFLQESIDSYNSSNLIKE
jgi:hypothetical protein